MLQYPQLQQLIILSFLLAAAINDVRKREVPNWVNYGIVAFGISLSLLQSIVFADWHFLAFSIVGAAAALALAALMFYTGQWGGGDSKLMIGMGAILGLPLTAKMPFASVESPIISFLTNLVLTSFLYALALGTAMAVKNWKKFQAAAREQAKKYSLPRKLLLIAAGAGLAIAAISNDFAIRLAVLTILISAFLALYLSMLAKAVEKSCMLKMVIPLKLTEGDWIAKDVVVEGKRIAGPKDLGAEKRQILQLISLYRSKKIKTVLVKEGIPFAPSFLLAYIATILFGNLLFAFAR